MASIDRELLAKHIERSIYHQDNPESFRYQMDHQIAKLLKAHEHNLKAAQTRYRAQKIVEEDLLRRKALQVALNQKMSKSKEMKDRRLQEYAQVLSDLRVRKQSILREKLKAQQKEEMRQSLRKISEIQERKNRVKQSRSNRSQTQKVLRSSSRYQVRIEAENYEHESLVQKLDSKGTFRMQPRIMSQLYFQKARHILKTKEEQEVHKAQMLVQTLSKIEKARQKKQKILADSSQKKINSQKYRFEMNRHRYNESENNRKQKIKELMIQHGQILKKSQSRFSNLRMERSNQKMSRLQISQSVDSSEKISSTKKGSYREEIRKCIDAFLKCKK